MIEQAELTRYLLTLLDCHQFKDYAPNGLQVEGSTTVETLCTAVTASQEAVNYKAQALLVHHGYFWKGESPTIVGMKKERVSRLLNANMNLYGFHLPLDCHLNLGNNACLAKLLKATQIESHTVDGIPNLLWTGEFEAAKTFDDLDTFLANTLNRVPMSIRGSQKDIKRIAWCSGGAQDYIEQAKILGADAYLSGEISERTYYQARELGIHYFSCGHHATERYGIQALGEHLSQKFDLKHFFIDNQNPV